MVFEFRSSSRLTCRGGCMRTKRTPPPHRVPDFLSPLLDENNKLCGIAGMQEIFSPVQREAHNSATGRAPTNPARTPKYRVKKTSCRYVAVLHRCIDRFSSCFSRTRANYTRTDADKNARGLRLLPSGGGSGHGGLLGGAGPAEAVRHPQRRQQEPQRGSDEGRGRDGAPEIRV